MKILILFKLGLLCGLAPLLIELTFFFTWWIARAYFAYDIPIFEIFRTPIVFLYVPIALIGIIMLAIFLTTNFKNYKIKFVIGILIILINFPILLGLRAAEMEIGPRAYLKIYNQSAIDFSELIIKEFDCQGISGKQWILGKLDQNENIVGFYYPDYCNNNEIFNGISGNLLLIKSKTNNYKLVIPIIHPGEVVKLKIEKGFILSKLSQ